MMPSQSTSPWVAQAVPDSKPLTDVLETDVVVIGAGIAGLTTAYLLTREKYRVVVLEDATIGSGETGRTTAHLTDALDDRYHKLIGYRGEDITRLVADSHRTAIDLIEKIVDHEKVECELVRLSGYLFLPPEKNVSELKQELKAVHRVGLNDVRLVNHLPLKGYDFGPALEFPRQGQFHPMKYLDGLARAIQSYGGKIFQHTHVTGVDGPGPFTVETGAGGSVTARFVVHATNAPLDSPAEIYSKEYGYRTYVMAFTVPAGSVAPGLYWDDDWPYHYLRLAPDEADPSQELLIVGGEDHKTGEIHPPEERFENLEAWVRLRFHQAGPVAYRWSGQVFETLDGLALLGAYPGKPKGIFVITGDSGMGMTHCTIGGILVTDLILGRKNSWTEVYDPARKPPKALMNVMKGNSQMPAEITNAYVKHLPGSAEHIPASSGEVIKEGKDPVAVFRDADGKVYKLSAVCTHRGCIVNWNGTEESWDCPCHGSRYDKYGQVINGPAVNDLQKLDT